MKRVIQVLRGVFFIVYLLILFFLVFLNNEFSVFYNLPEYLLPTIALLGVIITGVKFLRFSLKNSRTEYEFTSIVNHTFRTPLTQVNWFSKELEKDVPTEERLLLIQNINNATNKVLEIVDIFAGIKDVNDTAGYFFEATSVRDIVEKSISKYREEINKKKLKFDVSSFKDAPLLTIDLKKISFVIDSLIENAIFYTKSEGNIKIDSNSNSKSITVYIQDSGMGLTMRDKFRIFSKFYRSKQAVLMNPNGMGLKLYLSSIIIKRHSGKIYAKSEGKDKGSIFFVELPLHKNKKK